MWRCARRPGDADQLLPILLGLPVVRCASKAEVGRLLRLLLLRNGALSADAGIRWVLYWKVRVCLDRSRLRCLAHTRPDIINGKSPIRGSARFTPTTNDKSLPRQPFSLGAPDVPLPGRAEEKERARRRSVNVFAAYEK
jgi:hypothetical protein